MQRSKFKLAILILSGLVASCATGPEFVFVDESRVLAAVAIEEPDTVELKNLRPPSAIQKVESTIVAEPQLELRDDDVEARAAAAQAIITKNREDAVKDLYRRLRREYFAEIDDWSKAERAKLAGERLEGYKLAMNKFRAVFESYASERGPVLARLIVFTHFPELQPLPIDEARATTWQKYGHGIAVENRKKLDQIDDDFEMQVQSMTTDVTASYDAALANLIAAIVQKQFEAEDRAAVEAQQRVASNKGLVDSALISMTFTTKAAPAATATISGVPAPAKAPIPEFESPKRNASEYIGSQIRVWQAIKGYKPVAKGIGRDATDEFIEWIRTQSSQR